MKNSEDLIYLYQFGRGWRSREDGWRLPNGSPFCLKLETYLRMRDLPYTIVTTNDPRKGPYKKLPFIRYQNVTIADSQRIIEFLERRFGNPLHQHLSAKDLSVMHALRIMLEHHSVGILAYSRFKDPAGWEIMRKARLKGLPPIIGQLIVNIMQKRIHKFLRAQGLLEISPSEVYQQGIQDIEALAEQLQNKPYFLGDSPTALDATAFGFLANFLWDPMPTPLKQEIRARDNLLKFCERMREKYYPQEYWKEKN